jgi:hypothetical protein
MESLAPFAHDLAWRIQTRCNDVVAQPLAREEDNLGPDYVAIW